MDYYSYNNVFNYIILQSKFQNEGKKAIVININPMLKKVVIPERIDEIEVETILPYALRNAEIEEIDAYGYFCKFAIYNCEHLKKVKTYISSDWFLLDCVNVEELNGPVKIITSFSFSPRYEMKDWSVLDDDGVVYGVDGEWYKKMYKRYGFSRYLPCALKKIIYSTPHIPHDIDRFLEGLNGYRYVETIQLGDKIIAKKAPMYVPQNSFLIKIEKKLFGNLKYYILDKKAIVYGLIDENIETFELCEEYIDGYKIEISDRLLSGNINIKELVIPSSVKISIKNMFNLRKILFIPTNNIEKKYVCDCPNIEELEIDDILSIEFSSDLYGLFNNKTIDSIIYDKKHDSRRVFTGGCTNNPEFKLEFYTSSLSFKFPHSLKKIVVDNREIVEQRIIESNKKVLEGIEKFNENIDLVVI